MHSGVQLIPLWHSSVSTVNSPSRDDSLLVEVFRAIRD